MHGKSFHFMTGLRQLLLKFEDTFSAGHPGDQLSAVEWFGQILIGASLQSQHYFGFIVNG